MELKGPPSPAPIPLAQVHKGGGRYRKSTPWENPPILLALVTYPLCSAQSNGGTSLKQVVPSSCQSMLLPTGGLWSLRKRASLRAEAGLGWDRASQPGVWHHAAHP